MYLLMPMTLGLVILLMYPVVLPKPILLN
jgi:hypothetical protein